MNMLYLLIFGCVGLCLLVIHSYYTRGFRLTFNFFLFAFIAGVRKESGTFLAPSGALTQYPSPFVHTGGYPVAFSVMTTTMGWMLAFYLSWWLAERIVDRAGCFRGRLFPVLFFSGIVMAALAYAIEATAVSAGWWKWVFFDERFSGFLAGGVHFFALKAWFFVVLPFLSAFLLIECSRFRHAAWKCVFFLIPVSRLNVMLFFGPHEISSVYEQTAFLLLAVLALSSPLKLDYPALPHKPAPGYVENLPYAVLALVISFLAFADTVKIKDLALLACIVPLGLLSIMSLRQARLSLISVALAMLWFLGGAYAMPAVIPALAFFIFIVIGRLPWPKHYLYR